MSPHHVPPLAVTSPLCCPHPPPLTARHCPAPPPTPPLHPANAPAPTSSLAFPALPPRTRNSCSRSLPCPTLPLPRQHLAPFMFLRQMHSHTCVCPPPKLLARCCCPPPPACPASPWRAGGAGGGGARPQQTSLIATISCSKGKTCNQPPTAAAAVLTHPITPLHPHKASSHAKSARTKPPTATSPRARPASTSLHHPPPLPPCRPPPRLFRSPTAYSSGRGHCGTGWRQFASLAARSEMDAVTFEPASRRWQDEVRARQCFNGVGSARACGGAPIVAAVVHGLACDSPLSFRAAGAGHLAPHQPPGTSGRPQA